MVLPLLVEFRYRKLNNIRNQDKGQQGLVFFNQRPKGIHAAQLPALFAGLRLAERLQRWLVKILVGPPEVIYLDSIRSPPQGKAVKVLISQRRQLALASFVVLYSRFVFRARRALICFVYPAFVSFVSRRPQGAYIFCISRPEGVRLVV